MYILVLSFSSLALGKDICVAVFFIFLVLLGWNETRQNGQDMEICDNPGCLWRAGWWGGWRLAKSGLRVHWRCSKAHVIGKNSGWIPIKAATQRVPRCGWLGWYLLTPVGGMAEREEWENQGGSNPLFPNYLHF